MKLMKEKIKTIISDAISLAHRHNKLPSAEFPEIEVDVPKIASYGDFSTNIAMVTASVQKMPPRNIAKTILEYIKDPDHILAPYNNDPKRYFTLKDFSGLLHFSGFNGNGVHKT